MIDNNIIQSLGAGSGIDTNSLITQLTAIEAAAPQARIDSKREENEAQISDYGLLSSSLAALQDAADLLAGEEALFSKSASFTESTALVPSTITTDVQPGIYNVEVTEIAQAQSLAFAGFSEPTDNVGEGTLTISFGSWLRDATTDAATDFSIDADSESLTIDITSANNSLNGLRDAINDADAGVQASIIFDGENYRLSLLAESGDNNQLQITVSEEAGGVDNTDASGLSRFAFNENITDFDTLETQKGQDTELKVNGLTVYRETNVVDDVVQGLTLDVLQKAPGDVVTITVLDDTAFAETSVRDFVASYNTFLETMESVIGYNEVTGEDGTTETVAGSLANDSLTKSILSKVKSLIASSVPGLNDSNYTSLTNIGIRTELDGTLSIDEDDFAKGFSENFEDVQKLFGPRSVSDSDDVTVNSYGSNTLPGEYEVVITALPSQGYINGSDVTAAFPNFDTTGKDYSFKINIDGTESATITLPEGNYADESEMAAAIQSIVNSDANIKEGNERILVTYNEDDNQFEFTSSSYGVNSNVSISEASGDIAADLGIADGNGTIGSKVSGTVNGVAGFGSANVLLPAIGEPGEGLALIIGDGATVGTTSTVNYSRGFAGELSALMDEYLKSGGLIEQRETNLERELVELDDEQTTLDTRLTAFEDRLVQQYIAMESIINGLSSSGSFLDSLIDTLPFTSSN